MRTVKRIACFGVSVLMLSLIFTAGCNAAQTKSNRIAASKPSLKAVCNGGVIPTYAIKSIESSGEVSIADDSCAAIIWVPKSKNTTLSKVLIWIKSAELYKGTIPKSTFSGVLHANTNPSCLIINTSGQHSLKILPAFYRTKDDITGRHHFIPDVLTLTCDNHTITVKSKELYNWLKNDKWKSEFKME